MKKSLFAMTLLAALLIAVGAAVAFAGGTKTVYTRGDEVLDPNIKIYSNLRFSPGPVVIQSGDTVQWSHADKTEAPHTVTIATADQLVQSFEDFLGACPACDAAAGAALVGHNLFGGPPFVDVLDDGDGQFDDSGDSILFFHGQTVSAQINAPAGTTLLYFCALHPWMQGTIEVK